MLVDTSVKAIRREFAQTWQDNQKTTEIAVKEDHVKLDKIIRVAARDEEGNIFYTRNGAFNVNQQGYLVTSSGAQVLNSNNEPIYIGASNITVDNNNFS